MKIGILGGTFNPPHEGHLHAARAAAQALALDRVFLIPANIPPHKAGPAGATPAQRLAMTRLAAGNDGLFSVLDCELRRAGKSYTVDTLRALKAQYPGDEFWFIVGTDMFLTLQSWRVADVLLVQTGIAVVPRDDEGLALLFPQKQHLETAFGARVEIIDVPPVVASSTAIRAGRESARVSPAVAAYIKENGLYGSPL